MLLFAISALLVTVRTAPSLAVPSNTTRPIFPVEIRQRCRAGSSSWHPSRAEKQAPRCKCKNSLWAVDRRSGDWQWTRRRAGLRHRCAGLPALRRPAAPHCHPGGPGRRGHDPRASRPPPVGGSSRADPTPGRQRRRRPLRPVTSRRPPRSSVSACSRGC